MNRDFWGRQRVLLTGHTGFKGSWAALWLEQLGAQVHGLALRPDHVPDLHSRLAPFTGATSTIADINDLAAVRLQLFRRNTEHGMAMRAAGEQRHERYSTCEYPSTTPSRHR